MSNELKCPFCQQELKYESGVYVCRNPNCKHLLGFGSKELWQELIRTRKELEVGKSVLENISSFYNSLILANPVSDINWDVVAKNFAKHSDEALEQITALEQKE